MEKSVVTIGELLLRLSVPNYEMFNQTRTYNSSFGGSEANVAVALATYGVKSYYVTKLPQHDISQEGIHILRKYNVDTSYICHGGKRIGIYFLETGVGYRPSRVIYDREGSSMAEATIEDFDFEHLFKEKDWLHLSGITLAIMKNGVDFAIEACKQAKNEGLKISFDVNYRKKLWSIDSARKAIKKLMPYIDVYIGSRLDIETILEIGNREDTDLQVCQQVEEAYNVSCIVMTSRKVPSASHNSYSGKLYYEGQIYESPEYEVDIVDRVGTGDALTAGIIYGLLQGMNPEHVIDFGVGAAVLKHTVHGDFNTIPLEQIEDFIENRLGQNVER